MIRRLAIAIVLLCSWALCLGCEENTPDNNIPQFDRPQDVALVCYTEDDSDNREFFPLGCCDGDGTGVEGACDVPLANGKLLAFVTQTTYGEVAVVDLDNMEIIDQDERIPLNSFVPVGGQPSDIAASWDGTKIYTANFETEDLSVILAEQSFGPEFVSASYIPLGGPAARMAIASFGDNRDRFAFVTQPTLGRLAVVALQETVEDPEEDDNLLGLLGYLRLDRYTGIEHAPADNTPAGITPWSVVASDVTSSVFVGGKNGEYVLELDGDVLIQDALNLAEAGGEVGSGSIVRRLEMEGYTSYSMAVEPDLERWLYVVDRETGGVLVFDLVFGEMLPVSEEDPFAADPYLIDPGGRARAIKMVKLSEDDYLDPLTFFGTFAVVSTANAAVAVLDVEDRNAILYGADTRPHSPRSGVDIWCDLDAGTEDEEDDDEDTCNPPQLADEPELRLDNSTVSGDEYPHLQLADSIEEPDQDAGPDSGNQPTDEPQCGEEGVEFHPLSPETAEYGIRFRCDRRMTSNELWTLTWEGELGISGVGGLRWDGSEIILEDGNKDFCASGLVSDRFLGIYNGDLLEITSSPTPLDGADCSEFEEDPPILRVLRNEGVSTLVMEHQGGMMPRRECFSQAVSYTVRANKHWVLVGSRSGHMRRGQLDPGDSQLCLPYFEDEEKEAKHHWKNQRVWEDVEFYNYYLKFTLLPADSSESAEGFVHSQYETIDMIFETEYGFSSMGRIVGSDITDLEFTPDSELVVIDRAGEGLMLFDMTGDFDIIGSSVN